MKRSHLRSGRWTRLLLLVAGLVFVLNVGLCFAEDKPWWPVKVNAYYGTYDVKGKKPGRPAASLEGPKLVDWAPPEKANKPYTIGVSFPHLKDPYWLAVDFGREHYPFVNKK